MIDRQKWAGSHPEAGAVCVGADHGEAVSWQEASAHSEGDQAGEVPGHKVLKRDENGIQKSWIIHQTACGNNSFNTFGKRRLI